MVRTYFAWLRLKSGEYVNIVYNSEHRKGTWGNTSDLIEKAYNGQVCIDKDRYEVRKTCKRKSRSMGGYYWSYDFSDFIYIMNQKNMDEQRFNDYRVIDLREGE